MFSIKEVENCKEQLPINFKQISVLSKKQQEELEKEEKSRLKEEQKQYKKDVFIALLEELKSEFELLFEQKGTQAIYEFYDITKRKHIINKIGANTEEKHYIDKTYTTTLKEIYTKYLNNEKYKEYEQSKHINFNIEQLKNNDTNVLFKITFIIGKFLIYIFSILLSIIIFMLAVIFGMAKDIK